jgi:hypothetical protein
LQKRLLVSSGQPFFAQGFLGLYGKGYHLSFGHKKSHCSFLSAVALDIFLQL